MSKYLSLEQIIDLFANPDALKEVHETWGKYEPKSMQEAFSKIPSPPLIRLDA